MIGFLSLNVLCMRIAGHFLRGKPEEGCDKTAEAIDLAGCCGPGQQDWEDAVGSLEVQEAQEHGGSR